MSLFPDFTVLYRAYIFRHHILDSGAHGHRKCFPLCTVCCIHVSLSHSGFHSLRLIKKPWRSKECEIRASGKETFAIGCMHEWRRGTWTIAPSNDLLIQFADNSVRRPISTLFSLIEPTPQILANRRTLRNNRTPGGRFYSQQSRL